MKKYILILILSLMSVSKINSQTKLYLTANGITKTATLVSNQATKELISILEKGSITLSMTEYGGFEKTGTLPQYLTTSDERQTAQPGDIMLYVGNMMCIFIGSNTWAYTKLGSLDNMTSSEIKEFLYGNPVNVTISLEETAEIKQMKVSDVKDEKIYDLQGNLITKRPLMAGVYIVNGRKTIFK